jgi:hypothetical protein
MMRSVFHFRFSVTVVLLELLLRVMVLSALFKRPPVRRGLIASVPPHP